MPNYNSEASNKSSERPLKVAIICHSDTIGGASVVTHRLLTALRAQGVDARMIVFNRLSDDPYVSGVTGRYRRGVAFMAERLKIALHNGMSRKKLFKVSLASHGLPVYDHPWVKEADIILLSWINQGVLSLEGIRKLGKFGKPIVWVMHDMWNITGICHHAMECSGYQSNCGHCRYLTGRSTTDLSYHTLKRKAKLYNEVPITFVAVSNWLAKCCEKSSIMRSQDVRVIPNAFPVDSFFTEQTNTPTLLDDEGKQIILMGAARLDDSIKGLDMAIEALNHLFDNHPEVARTTEAVFFGDVRNPAIFDRLRFPFRRLGTVNDGNILRQLYARASVVLSTSLYETLPGTLIEGQAAGCLPVTFGRGGQSDIVDHLQTGYIARYCDTEDVANGILWALNQKIDPQWLHQRVRDKFSATAVAGDFIKLFHELLDAHNKKS